MSRAEFQRPNFEHFVILADHMSCDTALDLEERIQEEILAAGLHSFARKRNTMPKNALMVTCTGAPEDPGMRAWL